MSAGLSRPAVAATAREGARWVRRALWLSVLLLLAIACWAQWRTQLRPAGSALHTPVAFNSTPQLVAQGALLARAGNCAACHTTRGGAPLAGGRAILTPFGAVYGGNLTPDRATGLGAWSADDFWRALHHGESRDGRWLSPAFPYPHFTRVSRSDSDALYAYLRSVPPVAQAHKPSELRFPFNTQLALGVWRLFFFSAGEFQPDAAQSVEWNRGAYLVSGLGHCSACHAPRNALGAGSQDLLALGGGELPLQHWLAPSLRSPHEGGVADWPLSDVVALLRDGVSPQATVMGPMAEVVAGSTQHLPEADLRAIATFLKALPQDDTAPPAAAEPANVLTLKLGREVYGQHCADCHGEQGQGAQGAYPALAGNRAVTQASPLNALRMVLVGGYAPSTAGNPRPWGMPPLGPTLSDAEVAAVVSYIRQSWGHSASAATVLQAQQAR
ncbi:MAG: hypothetical protein RJA98_900 [Pseudomonadota bacterium]